MPVRQAELSVFVCVCLWLILFPLIDMHFVWGEIVCEAAIFSRLQRSIVFKQYIHSRSDRLLKGYIIEGAVKGVDSEQVVLIVLSR